MIRLTFYPCHHMANRAPFQSQKCLGLNEKLYDQPMRFLNSNNG